MALALLSVRGYGIEAEEALNKRYRQFLIIKGTAANTDATHDYGTYAGTFWTAVGATEPGVTALLAIKDIQTRSEAFLDGQGIGLATRAKIDASRPSEVIINSAASAGGAATETLVVTGALTTDSVKTVSQYVKGANGTALISWGGATGVIAVADALPVEWTANPGAGAKVRLVVSRTTTTPDAGTYQLALDATNTRLPNISFASGDAPTAFTIVLSWILKDSTAPVEVYKAA